MRINSKLNKFISCLLVVVMILTMIPNSIFAVDPDIKDNTKNFTINTYHFFDFPPNDSDDTQFTEGPYANSPYTPYWRYSAEYGESQGWSGGQMVEPDCFRTSTGEVTYCLQLGKVGPNNIEMQYNQNNLLDYNEKLLKVLKMGYPSKSGSDYSTSDAELEWATAVALKIIEGNVYTNSGASSASPLTLDAFEDGTLDKTFSRKYYNEQQLSDDQIETFNARAEKALALVTQLVNYASDDDILIDKIEIEKPDNTDFIMDFFKETFKAGPYKATTNVDEAQCVIKVEGLENYKIVDVNGEELQLVNFNQEFYIEGNGAVNLGKDFKVKAFAVGTEVLSQTYYSTNLLYADPLSQTNKPYQNMYVCETVTLNAEAQGEIVAPILYDVRFRKLDTDSKELITDPATFVLKDLKGNILESPYLNSSYTTHNGTFTLQLPAGSYLYQETKAPEGYIANDNDVQFNIGLSRVSAPDYIDIDVYNTLTSVSISKLDENGNFLPGASLTIYDNDGVAICNWNSLNEAHIIRGLSIGTYTIRETSAPEGYALNEEPFEFSIDKDGVVTGDTTIVNEMTKVVLTKTDLVDGTPVAGATIEIKDTQGNPVEGNPFITDNSGEIVINKLPIGTYTFKEIIAPDGYILNEEECTFTIDRNGEVTGKTSLTNESTHVEITKTDLINGEPVTGAIIEIKDSTGTAINESPFVTDNTGKIILDKLPIGTYTFKEIIAPDGYILNEEECTFTINEDGEVTGKTTLTNKPNKVVLSKTDLTTSEPVIGAVIEIRNSEGEPIEGSPFTTDSEGEITINKLPVGTYTFKETIAPEGYILNEDSFSFAIDEYGIITGDTEITNKPNEVVITKTDLVSSEPVVGATIEINDSNGEPIEGSPFITDNDGKITLNKLPIGTYTFKETIAPAGYILNESECTFSIDEHGIITGDTNITNKPTQVVITKTDLVSSEPIAGAVIEIKNSEGNPIAGSPFTTDSEGKITLNKLPVGTYTFKETIAPAGYILNEEECEFVINEDGSVTGKTTLTNEPNNTVITKLDMVTGQPVKGATIEIKNENGEHISGSPFITDENGEISINKLPADTYTFKEIIAPEGYILNEEECTFTIDEYGIITGKTILKNKPIYVVANKIDAESKESLENSKLSLYTKDGQFVESKFTDEEGKAIFYVLAGEYYIVEDIAPEGYIKTDEKYSFTVNTNGNVQGNLTIENHATHVKITKLDTETNKGVKDSKVAIYDKNGKFIGEFMTDKFGEINLYTLPVGEYIYTEIEAPKGYIKTDETFTFVVDKYGVVTGDTTFKNAPTKVIITKIDAESEKPLANALFEFRKDNNLICTQESNSDGELIITHLEVGTYKFKEITAPDGYAINETVYEFTINKDGTVTGTTTVSNKRITVELFKRSADSGDLLAGAQFIVKDKDGKTIIDGITNEQGKIVINKIAAGEYTLREIAAPDGYTLNTTTYLFTVHEDGSVTGTTTIYNEKDKAPVEKPEDPTEPEKPKDETTDTGDNSQVNGYGFLFAGIIASLGFVLITFKKKKQHK